MQVLFVRKHLCSGQIAQEWTAEEQLKLLHVFDNPSLNYEGVKIEIPSVLTVLSSLK